VTTKEHFLSKRQRYQPIALPQHFSDEEMARDWTLLEGDQHEIERYRKDSRLYIAVQICAIRLYGRFLQHVHDLSPHIINYLGQQLDLPPSLTVEVPEREATYLEQHQNILKHLGFQRFDHNVQAQLEAWIAQQARLGTLPDALFQQAENHLLAQRVLLPGPSVLERLIIHVCSEVHLQLFETVFRQLSPALRQAIDRLLMVPDGEQRSTFFHLKEYPPAPSISSIQSYLQRYHTVAETGIDAFENQVVTPEFLDYFFKQAKRYNATDIKRFADHKRYTMMICFLLETRKTLLDHLVMMHDQYVMDISRQTRNAYEKKHRELRKRQKRAIDVMLDTTDFLLEWPDEQPLSKDDIWRQVEEVTLRSSRNDLQEFQRLEERGYGDILLNRLRSWRRPPPFVSGRRKRT
jgi:dsDNA-binding SOS-regulon protein